MVKGPAGSEPAYSREDLGTVRFYFPQLRAGQKASSSGLAALPDKWVGFLMENPHAVDVPYLGRNFEVWVPQVGRFILQKGLQLGIGRGLDPDKVYEAAHNLLMVLELLVPHAELQEEALNDMAEIRPPGLARDFLSRLKDNGPGGLVWDSAQKLYLQRHPHAKPVVLTKWYWNFIPAAARSFHQARKNDE